MSLRLENSEGAFKDPWAIRDGAIVNFFERFFMSLDSLNNFQAISLTF
jgi:hypothetical protein